MIGLMNICSGLVIHKNHIDEDVLKILQQEPTLLPPWDPMFASEK